MSNLNSAKQALRAELQHARQGAAFYQARADALEEALSKIDSVETSEPAPHGRRAAHKAAPATGRRRAGRPKATQKNTLPPTGKAFWLGVINSQPQSARDILEGAVRALGADLNDAQMKKLLQRQTTALHNLVKSGAISDSGSGRERRFYRAQ
jgi:hypothetical protein